MSPKGMCQPRLKLARVRAGMPEFVGRGPLWPEPRRRAEEEKEMQRRACAGTVLASRGSHAQGPAFLCRAAEAMQGTWPPVPILPVSLAARGGVWEEGGESRCQSPAGGVLVMCAGRDNLCGEMPPLGDSAFFQAWGKHFLPRERGRRGEKRVKV